MIRRDAHTDLQIAEVVEKHLGKPLATTEHARSMAIYRYRKAKEFTKWLDRWENQDLQLKAQISAQKQKFEFLKGLVGTGDDNGLNAVAKSIQARLLTLAAEASDEDLMTAKWIKPVIRLVQEQSKLEQDRQVEKLKTELTRLTQTGGKGIDGNVLVAKVDEILGLKKK